VRIKVFAVGSTLIDVDSDHLESTIRTALQEPGVQRDVVADCTDAWCSDISTDDYAIVCEDDGVLLWHGWLTGAPAAPPPPQAQAWLTGMSARDRAASFEKEAR
jgi:hypothetical protein